MRPRNLGAALLAMAAVACGPPPSGAPVVSSPPPPAPLPIPTIAPTVEAAPPPAPRPRLEAPGPFLDLAIDRYPAAVVSIPIGADGKRPVVVATHGNYDRPEWQCDVWRAIVDNRAFVLCPRGDARPDSPSRSDARFTYRANRALEAEVAAGLAALAARFPEFADVEAPLYTGFSLGAIMGVAIAGRTPARYPRLVLVEGGQDRWTDAAIDAFARGGGKRVLFVCSQPSCAPAARESSSRLVRAGIATRIAESADVGHRYDGPVAEATRGALDWVLEGDDRWPPVEASPTP